MEEEDASGCCFIRSRTAGLLTTIFCCALSCSYDGVHRPMLCRGCPLHRLHQCAAPTQRQRIVWLSVILISLHSALVDIPLPLMVAFFHHVASQQLRRVMVHGADLRILLCVHADNLNSFFEEVASIVFLRRFQKGDKSLVRRLLLDRIGDAQLPHVHRLPVLHEESFPTWGL